MTIFDPVCKMECDEKHPSFRSEHKGKAYCFCSLACKKMFDKDPERYLSFWKGV